MHLILCLTIYSLAANIQEATKITPERLPATLPLHPLNTWIDFFQRVECFAELPTTQLLARPLLEKEL